MARIGILGGSFNPPHNGHLILAQEAFYELNLNRLYLMPVNKPPHKQVTNDPGGQIRLRLCELAVAGDDRFKVSRVEIDRPGLSYTEETLKELHKKETSVTLDQQSASLDQQRDVANQSPLIVGQNPTADSQPSRTLDQQSPMANQPSTTYILILGSDMAQTIPQWREPHIIVELAEIAVVEREGRAFAEVAASLRSSLGVATDRIHQITMPRVDISSSLIRKYLSQGRSVRYLVPDRVADYIEANNLYVKNGTAIQQETE